MFSASFKFHANGFVRQWWNKKMGNICYRLQVPVAAIKELASALIKISQNHGENEQCIKKGYEIKKRT